MPLSEFLRRARGKLESSHQKPSPAEISSRSENELVELVWENGQVVMQGQSSRVARSPTLNNLHSNTNRVRDPGVGHGAMLARYGKFGLVESIMNDMASVVPSGDMDLSQDDEISPWLSYPIDDAMGQDYVSDILPQISGVTANGLSTQNSFVSVYKRSSCEQTVSNLQSGVKVSPSSKDRPFGSWLPQHRQTSDGLGSGVTHIVSNNSMDAVFRNPAQSRDTVDDSASMAMERQNIPTPTNNSNFLNFSHFSRSATLAKPNLPNSDGIPKSVSSVAERLENKEKGSAANHGNPVKLMNIERLNSIPKEIDSRGSGTLPKVNSRELVVKTPQDPERTKNLFQETSIRNDKPLILSNDDGAAKGAPEGERIIEPVVASSSVGSGNSADRVSCEQTQHSKRKFHDMEDSECRSDDLETESVDAKKGTGVRGSKRSRAAEVHNLSERRRRDRINEKMRALQELIPNCNKADKASMLDEAIEYLKTLQLQVQIMSMGSGLCMPPMMFPTGIQHMHPAHVQHFQPMGVGMGMGMAFGMGMPDMNGGSSSCPIYPVPPLQVPAFPSPMSGLANFQRMPGPNHPVFGHPGQAFPNSGPRQPFVPLAPRPPVNSAMGSTALRTGGSTSEIPSTSQVMNSGDPATTMKSQPMLNAEATNSVNNKSNQLQPTNEVQEKSVAVQDKKQATDAGGSAARSSANATDINKEPGCD